MSAASVWLPRSLSCLASEEVEEEGVDEAKALAMGVAVLLTTEPVLEPETELELELEPVPMPELLLLVLPLLLAALLLVVRGCAGAIAIATWPTEGAT